MHQRCLPPILTSLFEIMVKNKFIYFIYFHLIQPNSRAIIYKAYLENKDDFILFNSYSRWKVTFSKVALKNAVDTNNYFTFLWSVAG